MFTRTIVRVGKLLVDKYIYHNMKQQGQLHLTIANLVQQVDLDGYINYKIFTPNLL